MFINIKLTILVHETVLTTLEEKRPDALEVAAQADEEGEEAPGQKVAIIRYVYK